MWCTCIVCVCPDKNMPKVSGYLVPLGVLRRGCPKHVTFLAGMKDEEDTLQGKAINRRGFFSLMYSRVLLFLFLGGRPRGALS